MSIDPKRYSCLGADKIIAVLNKLNTPSRAMSLPELLEEVNKNIPLRKNKLNYTNIRRLVRNVESNQLDSDKLGSFQDNNDRNVVKYYVIFNKTTRSKVLTANKKGVSKSIRKPDQKNTKDISIKKSNTVKANTKVSVTRDEKSYYPEILEFLQRNNTFDNESYLFKIKGESRANGKWQNPDLIGSNTRSEGRSVKMISVEVKTDTSVNAILVGLAQCCFYRTSSNYVLFFCRLDDQNKELINTVSKFCNYYGIGLRINDESRYRVQARETDAINRDIDVLNNLNLEFHR